MSDFDQLLDQALAEFAASQGTITPEKQADQLVLLEEHLLKLQSGR